MWVETIFFLFTYYSLLFFPVVISSAKFCIIKVYQSFILISQATYMELTIVNFPKALHMLNIVIG